MTLTNAASAVIAFVFIDTDFIVNKMSNFDWTSFFYLTDFAATALFYIHCGNFLTNNS
ncbi:hypothetical protein SDC9_140152 [bioreactor metagenome]|uniref:Uncharacterized protein n=1 Tax=bioreactor metagenome TaxID=1076179 RepID=A0A645DUI7_9ZZZZ